MTRIVLNPYRIYWFTMIPLKGIVTKKDARIISGMRNSFSRDSEISVHNGSKEKALQRIEALKGKLSKPYSCVLYTDKQFGMRDMRKPVSSVLTTKQLSELQIIK